jgi:hypothetical protein
MPCNAHQHEDLVLRRCISKAPVAAKFIEKRLVPVNIAYLWRDEDVGSAEFDTS